MPEQEKTPEQILIGLEQDKRWKIRKAHWKKKAALKDKRKAHSKRWAKKGKR